MPQRQTDVPWTGGKVLQTPSLGAASGFPSLVAVVPTHPGLCYQPQRGAMADQRVTSQGEVLGQRDHLTPP